MTEAVNFFSAETEPYYLPLADEVEVAESGVEIATTLGRA